MKTVLCLLLFLSTKSFAWKSDFSYGQITELNKDGLHVYNAGIKFRAQNSNGVSFDLRTAVDGHVDDITEEDFELERYVKEMKLNYKHETEDMTLFLSVGKIAVSVKADRDSPSKVGGVMGFKLSLTPKEASQLQSWLSLRNLKIYQVSVSRYSSSSRNKLDMGEFAETDMTAYSFSAGTLDGKAHVFAVVNEPDSDSHAPRGRTFGASYQWKDMKFRPTFFALVHTTRSNYVDLKVNVFSLSMEVWSNSKLILTYSKATERKTSTEKEIYEIGVKTKLGGKHRVFGVFDFEATYMYNGIRETVTGRETDRTAFSVFEKTFF